MMRTTPTGIRHPAVLTVDVDLSIY